MVPYGRMISVKPAQPNSQMGPKERGYLGCDDTWKGT